jgi:hypothetical protein
MVIDCPTSEEALGYARECSAVASATIEIREVGACCV